MMGIVRSLIVLGALALLACDSGRSPTAVTSSNQTISAASLVRDLRAGGFEIRLVDTVQQPFFRPKAEVYRINGDDLQLYEYSDANSAEAEAARVSHNGAIGGSMPLWIAPPHFYRKGSLIAIYLGSNPRVMQALTRARGPQFAGQ
jgi:hypothetical protein